MLMIFKYKLFGLPRAHDRDEVTINVPRGAHLLHVGLRSGKLMLWAEVNPENSVVPVALRIVGTGHEVPEGHHHRWTFFEGPFVWHVYVRDGTA